MKKNNIKTKVIATTLSAITVFSAAAFATTTAFAAEKTTQHLSTGTTVTNELKVSLDRDLKYATSITSATIRELLNKNGFDTSNLPKNTNIVTKNAFDDSVNKLSAFVMYNYQKAYYNGINIDAKGAGEQKIQILDCGINGWKWQKWNYMKGGNACVFNKA